MTFSIVANVGEAFGVAVASKFLAVGSVVPNARLGVGAVATQAVADVSWRARALELLASGATPDDAITTMVADNARPQDRQLGLVDSVSQATYTGKDCLPWCGGVAGRDSSGGYAIQGNVLAGEEVIREAEQAWLTAAYLPLENRLTYALLAADRAGGDRRGRQSAAIYAVEPGAGYDQAGVLVDLRVDDHPEAPQELARLVDLSELYFGTATNVLPLEGPLATEVRAMLDAVGQQDQPDLHAALATWAGLENYETRLSPDGIDARVLQALREAAAQ